MNKYKVILTCDISTVVQAKDFIVENNVIKFRTWQIKGGAEVVAVFTIDNIIGIIKL